MFNVLLGSFGVPIFNKGRTRDRQSGVGSRLMFAEDVRFVTPLEFEIIIPVL
jgi:hypothetical protein